MGGVWPPKRRLTAQRCLRLHLDGELIRQRFFGVDTETDGATELTISERNLPSKEGKALSEQTWKMVLEQLEALLEGRDGAGAG